MRDGICILPYFPDRQRLNARQVLIVTTGNITNDDLLALFAAHLDDVLEALQEGSFVELGGDRLIVHRSRAQDPEDGQ